MPRIDRTVASTKVQHRSQSVIRRGRIAARAVVFCVAAACAGHAKEIFVSPAGVDGNDGSEKAPLRSLQKASEVVKAGDVVIVLPGTYEGGIVTTASGTAEAPIEFRSSQKWGAKIVPPAMSSGSTGWGVRGEYITVRNFELDGTEHRDGIKWRTGIAVVGSYSRIIGNHVHHIATRPEDCVQNGASGVNANNVHHGYHIEVIANVVHDVGSVGCKWIGGIYFSTSGVIKNNLVYDCSEFGMQTWHDATDIDIANNTFARNGTGIMFGASKSAHYHRKQPADNIHVYGNIAYANRRVGIVEMGSDVGLNNTVADNLVYGNGKPWSLQHDKTATGTIEQDPQFRDAEANDFRLKPGSPAIDRGASAYAPKDDFEGRPRSHGKAPDMGAFEYDPSDTRPSSAVAASKPAPIAPPAKQ